MIGGEMKKNWTNNANNTTTARQMKSSLARLLINGISPSLHFS
jgi:hypothetical protein